MKGWWARSDSGSLLASRGTELGASPRRQACWPHSTLRDGSCLLQAVPALPAAPPAFTHAVRWDHSAQHLRPTLAKEAGTHSWTCRTAVNQTLCSGCLRRRLPHSCLLGLSVRTVSLPAPEPLLEASPPLWKVTRPLMLSPGLLSLLGRTATALASPKPTLPPQFTSQHLGRRQEKRHEAHVLPECSRRSKEHFRGPLPFSVIDLCEAGFLQRAVKNAKSWNGLLNTDSKMTNPYQRYIYI